MIDPEEFESAVAQIAALNGIDAETALAAMTEIGDTPLIDADGKAAVTLPDGRQLRLVLPEY